MLAVTEDIVQLKHDALVRENGQQFTAELALRGSKAKALVDEIDGVGVTGLEYLEIAEALRIGGRSLNDALAFYRRAQNVPPADALTVAEAHRGEGLVYYSVGRNDQGHQSFLRAVRVAEEARDDGDADSSVRRRDAALSYVLDAQSLIQVGDCALAADDLRAVQDVAGDLLAGTKNLAAQHDSAMKAYRAKCG
ncbi:hypothetical protein KIH74_11230 [Kineosporia sp. J2-2]|uniref:Uncharacterized protein n=1 Tax=Kineosporia corallincola TaxID=2835133 RepID=A0ABS5TH44_9ACTN|nr:hypothetical protein [Kineosporia corallincola]MBT0769496.1 hypothetical protein [Kineosporia corallincola]